jgi:hypothetical protein
MYTMHVLIENRERKKVRLSKNNLLGCWGNYKSR